MINKLKYLTKMSLAKKMKTKWFLLANLAFLVLIVGLINIDSIINYFGGDFNKKTEILVMDNTASYDDFKNYYNVYNDYLKNDEANIVKYDKALDEAKKEVKEKGKVLLVFNASEENFLDVTLITKNNIDSIVYQIINSAVNDIKKNLALKYYNISDEMLVKIDNPVVIERVKLDDSKSLDETMELVMGTVFPIIILPFFMLTMFLVQMIGAEINEEKTTKGMEIIISNVSPQTHFTSKVLAGNIFVIIQGCLLFIYGALGLLFRKIINGSIINDSVSSYVGNITSQLEIAGILKNLGYIIPLTIILMLVTFVAYSLAAGILASMTTNMEDYQQVQTPIILISLVGYYLSMMATMFEGSMFIKILSYVPFISALLSPALLVLGQITICDLMISFVILCIFIWFLYRYGLKIYKVGILNYSSSHIWQKMFKAVKSK